MEPYAAVSETHAGVVFLVGERAYKAKKPVQFGFLDFRRRETRQAVCHREVELNRRLAADVYLGVIDLVGSDGQLVDHLVEMRRMPAERSLARLAREHRPVDPGLRSLARLLAAFHSRAATSEDIAAAAGADAQRERWDANWEEMERFGGRVLDPSALSGARQLAERYLQGREPLFDARIAAGRARDGHGDLLADDVFLLDDGPRVLDCIEFDDRLRWGDTLGDIAFLAMDLERLDRPDLARRLLDWYREYAPDRWPASLAHHYVAYRAQVRAKVSCLRWDQGDARSAEDARGLLDITSRHLEAGSVRLVMVGGLPGTGKSTIAAWLGETLGAAVVRSDEVRKQMAGLDPHRRAPGAWESGLYRPDVTAATYAEMLRRARPRLANGESVVLDASWRHPEWRQQARGLGGEMFAEVQELRCVAPRDVAENRLRSRARRGGDPSDATPAVARAMEAAEAAWPEATALDTDAPPEAVLERALGALGLAGLEVRGW